MAPIKKIGFLVHNNQYDSKRVFTKGLREALRRRGIDTFLVDTAHGELEASDFERICNEAPDCLATFSQIVPALSGRFICDDLKLPHLSILLDPVVYSLPVTGSSYSIISCVDRQDVAWLERMGFAATFFLPHAVEVPEDLEDTDRPLPVVFLGSCYDHERYRDSWYEEYPEDICYLMNEAVDILLGDSSTSIVDSVFQVWKAAGRDPSEYDLSKICFDVDYYARGLDRYQLISSFERSEVHIFGEVQWATVKGAQSWSDHLASRTNIQVHPPIPYSEVPKVLSAAQVCLNSSPFFKDGTHERIFNSMAYGCVTVTNRNVFMEEFFLDGEDVILFDHGEWEFLEERVHALLETPKRHKHFVRSAWDKVRKEHTWDQRAETLLNELPPIVALMQVVN